MDSRIVYCVHERPMHSPLALGCLISYAKAYRNSSLEDAYSFDSRLHWSARRLLREMRKTGPGIRLFPHYEWNTRECLRISKAVKRAMPECITIHGGPSVQIPRAQRTPCGRDGN